MIAFLFSKIGLYLVGGLLIAALVGGGYWYVKHLQGQVADLRIEVENFKVRVEIVEKAQKATDEFMKKKNTVRMRVVKEKANVDKMVESGDDVGMQQLFINNGLLQRPQTSSSPSR